MSKLSWETLDHDQFRVFLRDVSGSSTINLKHMIEDDQKDLDKEKENEKEKGLESKESKKSKMGKKSKEKPMKAADKIRQENTQRLYQRTIDQDQKSLVFIMSNLNDKDPYEHFGKLVTEEAKTDYKCRLLGRYWKKRKKYLNHVLILYFHLQKTLHIPEETQKLFLKIEHVLEDYEVKGYMLEKLGHQLPPLNFWDQQGYTLDPWQREVIGYIRLKESVTVRAPTSAGKTFVAMAAGILSQKILYVCPAKPVAYQVGANFQKMGYKVHFIVENHQHSSYDSRTNIFVGTPEEIEESLPKMGCSFDYAVFDEIHTLNDYDSGLCYENIVKILRCPFLALSATIENTDFLRDIFQRYNRSQTIHHVEYKKRFINQQRWTYDGSLRKIHPITCWDGPGSLRDIPFSPNDCYTLYSALSALSEDSSLTEDLETQIDALDPEEYFSGQRLLTLDDTKEYEVQLKEILDRLSAEPAPMAKILLTLAGHRAPASQPDQPDSQPDQPASQPANQPDQDSIATMIPFLKTCKKKDLFPMLYFHTEEQIAKEIFVALDRDLRECETKNYPFHYIIKAKKQELFRAYQEARKTYADGIKIKTKDAMSEKESRLDDYDTAEKQLYIQKILEYYEWCIVRCQKNEDDNMRIQIKNLEKEQTEFLRNPDFRYQDVYRKHPSYCFTKGEPMSGDDIRAIKRQIKKSAGLDIDYEDPLFQLLKRGIGLYLKSLPDEYNWIIQRLLGQKKLGVVISDRTLCLGIDLPIRSVALSGYRDPLFSTSDYLQMSGRAGRRGKDTQGNIIFHGLATDTYLPLMKGRLPELVGSHKPLYDSYNALTSLNPQISLEDVCKDRVNERVQALEPQIIRYEDPRFLKVRWLLRYYSGASTFVDGLLKIEKKIFRETDRDRESFVVGKISETLLPSLQKEYVQDAWRQNRITDALHIPEIVGLLKALGIICIHLINHLNHTTYMITLTHAHKIFLKARILAGKYQLLTETTVPSCDPSV